ncbi:alpha/beta fold hydrolase [Tepidicaulis sp.]|jgi:poly(3-hydroxyalkanoate) depolymerase|uniref:alpha/beta fold hydrolase n=1 Tax=Tepidicaulis sp. TaxID=1920809 RepID=UPI003B5912AC
MPVGKTPSHTPHLPKMRYPTIGGQKLRVAIWEGSGRARPILFFNGIGANLELAAPLGEAFTDRDVITFDMPGIGKSPAPRWPYRAWQAARLARKVLDEYGYDEVDVLGVSWGGAMAQQFAMQYRARVGKLMLAATSAGMVMVPGKPKALSKLAHPRRYLDPAYLMRNFEQLYGDDPNMAETHAISILPPTARGYMFQLLAMAGWTSVPFLPFLPHPTLIMMGDRDNIVPLANGHILKTLIPQSRLHVVKGGGHLFLVSRADEIIPVMQDFLDTPEEFEGAGAPAL